MSRNNTIVLVIILVIFAISLWAVLPIQGERFGRKGMHLGLDLVGGVHLVYQADFPRDATAEEKRANMNRALITIQRRIDKYGVSEPIIQQLGDDRVLVQLPGFTDIEAAKRLVEQTGFLDFKEVELDAKGQPVYLRTYLDPARVSYVDASEKDERVFVDEEGTFLTFVVEDKDAGILFVDEEGKSIDRGKLVSYPSQSLSWIPARGDNGAHLTGEFLADTAPTMSQGIAPKPEVSIEWNAAGGELFDQIARRLYNSGAYGTPQRALGIFLDNIRLSAPQILEQAYHGSGVITGDFTLAEVDELANLLKSGALPMPLAKPPLYQEKVSATLGANFIQMSWLAGLIGIILVMLFMVAYYRLPGFLASLALVFYGALVLAIFKLWPVTLSLAGLGGFILSIGMAVDANVLIFERMKEELRMGRTLGAAVEAGFNRAWSGIRDSNITTIIVCVILVWLASAIVASAPVMGFAWTLLIGVAVSMFTAIVVTRTLLRLVIHGPLGKKTALFIIDRGKK
ncbi:MAG: protein translocase subunit SecD [Chloroflexota bacterium]